MSIIKIFTKLVILWEKKKFLTLLEMENQYIESYNWAILSRDVEEIRKQKGILQDKKKRTTDEEKQIIALDKDINETEKYRQMINGGKDKMEDLKNQIKMYRKNIWK